MRSLRQLAEEAYLVQDAANLAGVLRGAARALDDLREHTPEGGSWDWSSKHSIMKLWSDKISQLTGAQTLDASGFGDAYDDVRKIMEGGDVRTG